MLHAHFMDSQETKQIKKTINQIAQFLIKEIGGDLITIHLAGTILTAERKPSSDIDLFCIVSSDFNFDKEDQINAYFMAHKNDLCGGRETRFHGIPMSELEGGKPKSRITARPVFGLSIRVLVKQFPYYKLIWGRKLDFSKFPTYGIPLAQELEYWLKFAEMNVKKVKSGKFDRPFEDFIKMILRLSNVDAQLNYGYNFDPSFRKLAKYLEKEENHIVHLCLKYRSKVKPLTQKEKDHFLAKAESYVRDLIKKVKKTN